LYEYTVLDTLKDLSFTLHRTGGADDKGIDLSGSWTLGDKNVPVVIQCKNEAKKIGPRYIRELCGIARSDTLLVMASVQGYTEKSMQTFMRAEKPICLLVIDVYDDGGALRQLIWNAVADTMLNGLAVRLVHRKDHVVLKVTYEDKALKKVK